jgi:lipoprotein-releasing system permease protein
MFGVGIGAAALVVVLSVFNGLEDLTRELHTSYNPEIKIVPRKGKSLRLDSALLVQMRQHPDILCLTEVIEDNALLRYQDAQMAVNIKGVSDNFHQQYPLENKLKQGVFKISDAENQYALLGYGVQARLSIVVTNAITPLQFWYPKKDKKTISPTNPLSAFNQGLLMPAGVLFIEQQFDHNSVIVPLEFARQLMDYQDQRTSIEIKTTDSRRKTIKRVQSFLTQLLGEEFVVQNADEQQATILRAFKIERLFAYITFSFILAVASFNIFFSLAMLAIEKRHDIAILQAIGASKGFIRRTYLALGGMIALSGAILGLLLGFGLIWLQQEFGIVKLGIEASLISAYPVKMYASDFVLVGITVAVITFVASWVPARNAALVRTSENL